MAGDNRADDKTLVAILNDIDILPQLYQCYVTSEERCLICLPERNYYRYFSLKFLNVISDYYSAFVRNTPPVRVCYLCFRRHGWASFCLPNLFTPASLDAFVDLLEWKRNFLSFDDDLVSLTRLCGFLSLRTDVVNAFFSRCIGRFDVHMSGHLGPPFVYELYSQGYLQTAEHLSRGIDHPSFYLLMRQCKSYRQIMRRLRGYHRSKATFSRTYTFYPLVRVRFSRARNAYYFDYYPED